MERCAVSRVVANARCPVGFPAPEHRPYCAVKPELSQFARSGLPIVAEEI